MPSKKVLYLIDNCVNDSNLTLSLQALRSFDVDVDILRADGIGKQLGAAEDSDLSATQGKSLRTSTSGVDWSQVRWLDYEALVIVSGGAFGSLYQAKGALGPIRDFVESGRLVVSVSYAVRVLIAAGVARGRRMTGHPDCATEIEGVGGKYVQVDRCSAMRERNLITAVEGPDVPEWVALLVEAMRDGSDGGERGNVQSRAVENLGDVEHSRQSRHSRGLATLGAVSGGNHGPIVETLSRLSPDFATLIVETGYGDLISRPGLCLKSRELATVATLTTLGNAEQALKFHCAGMLNTGWTPRELTETVLHALVYAGFPAVSAAMAVVREVLLQRGVENESTLPTSEKWESQRSMGQDELAGVYGAVGSEMEGELARLMLEFGCHEIWSRPGLSIKDRQFASLAMLITKGNQIGAVTHHLESCLKLGWTRVELTELLAQMTGYVGWPITLAVTGAALDVFERSEREGQSGQKQVKLTATDLHPHGSHDDRPATAFRGKKSEHATLGNGRRGAAVDLESYDAEFCQEKIFGRRHLDAKTRELAIIAALTATCRASDSAPLEVHINAALDAGATWEDIEEVMLQMVALTGFVAVGQSMARARLVLRRRCDNAQ